MSNEYLTKDKFSITLAKELHIAVKIMMSEQFLNRSGAFAYIVRTHPEIKEILEKHQTYNYT